MCPIRILTLVAAGAVSSAAASADQWTWDFDGDLSARAGANAALAGFGTYSFETDVINGQSAQVVRYEAGSGGGSDARFTVTNPVGPIGGSFTNQFTLIMDVKFPPSTWVSLFQTNTANANDGDCFINSSGGIGINGDYEDAGNDLRFDWGEWRRLAIVIDTDSPANDATFRIFADGQLQNVVQSPGSWGTDGRFSLESTFFLFADESGDTPDEGWVNCVQIRDYAMSDTELADLGGAHAAGVPGDPPDHGGSDFHVGPILQTATPTSIWIVWESLSGEESRVDYGPTDTLGSTAFGDAIQSNGASRIHRTQLVGLTPDTPYYYNCTTGSRTSETYRFRTPPLPDAEQPFRFAAMSDTQADGGNPDKLAEVTVDGVIAFVRSTFGPILEDELAFMMNAGDLVSSGDSYDQWKHDFFDESEPLYHHIPLYPVFGNHEGDTHWFLDYFHLPENGSAGYQDHWYYSDYGNVRIIGLDSNSGYTNQTQLTWLASVLADTATSDDIDFVFAQLHHPHKSELWTPGETTFSGDVVGLLERFTEDSGKPSVHFFGHTHGYSRGQSRDHQHLWVNIASGEGNPDYWGEYPQADYDEFQYSTPDWGFVLVEVEAGAAPRFTLSRISRGNEFISRENEVLDTITLRMGNGAPEQPTGVYPTIADSPVSPDGLMLQASGFADPDADEHWESHFQVTATSGDYSSAVIDEWNRFENWYSPPDATGPSTGYYSVNTVADPDVTHVSVAGLQANQTYYWRVRYRDEGLEWSDWSDEVEFNTGESTFGPNLLANPGAERGVADWLVVDPPLESLAEGDCLVNFSPRSGDRLFAIGGVCAGEGEYGEAYQSIDVSDFADEIDAGLASVVYAGWMRDWAGTDRPEIWAVFLDAGGSSLAATPKLAGAIPAWTFREGLEPIPVATRAVEFHMSGTRGGGQDNDSYLDDLSLRIGTQQGCPPDVNGDGVVNSQDVVLFLNLFVAQDPGADYNRDGVINSQDFVGFLNAFVAGC
jgi:hypothetical protein